MRRICLVMLCAFSFLLLGAAANNHELAHRSSDEIEDSFLGIQSNLNFSGRVPNDNDYAIMDSIASTGVKWVRYWLCWYQVEYDSGVYDFAATDAVVDGYDTRGLNVYLTLFSGNQWYDGPDSSIYDSVAHPEYGLAPTQGSASMQGWLSFVDSAVVRYRDRVKYWDIWNEPNIDFWQPVPNAQNYAYLLKQTSQKIKSIDPSAKVIGLGTSTIDFGYISEVLQEDVIGDIDFLGFHPYRYFPEDDQDNLGPWYPPTPYTNYEEELQGLLDTLAKYDTLGRVQLWDEEAGYPSQPEIFIWTPDTIFSSEATQAKYLLRRCIMNLAFDVAVTTWFYDWDQVSSYPSILGPTWYQHYYNMNLYEKEVPFPFSFLGITYSSPADTLLIEAETYDSLYAPLKDGGTFLYTNDGDGDLQGSAVYFVNVPDSALYTVWLRMRNPDETAAFLAYVDDTIPYWATNALGTGTGTLFIWSLPVDTELIRWHYLYRGRHFFNLNSGIHRLQVRTGLDGGSIDKIVIKREGQELTMKPAWNALQNLAASFDDRVVSDTILGKSFDNVDVPIGEWGEFRGFAFRDTSSNRSLVPYWLGLKIADDFYPDYHVNITIFVDSVVNPSIISFLDGSITPITEFTVTDSSVIFDSLPISDYPCCLAFSHAAGIEENERAVGKWSFTCIPNPFREKITISLVGVSEYWGIGGSEINIIDVSGRVVKQFILHPSSFILPAELEWDGRDDAGVKLASGVYFLKMQVGDCEVIRKLIFIR
jgi:hypothetical protein